MREPLLQAAVEGACESRIRDEPGERIGAIGELREYSSAVRAGASGNGVAGPNGAHRVSVKAIEWRMGGEDLQVIRRR
jgi:hypothetical protein